MSAHIVVHVNGERRQLLREATIGELVRTLGLEGQRGVAIAVSDEVVPKSTWGTRVLQDGEALLVIRASQGG